MADDKGDIIADAQIAFIVILSVAVLLGSLGFYQEPSNTPVINTAR